MQAQKNRALSSSKKVPSGSSDKGKLIWEEYYARRLDNKWKKIEIILYSIGALSAFLYFLVNLYVTIEDSNHNQSIRPGIVLLLFASVWLYFFLRTLVLRIRLKPFQVYEKGISIPFHRWFFDMKLSTVYLPYRIIRKITILNDYDLVIETEKGRKIRTLLKVTQLTANEFEELLNNQVEIERY